MPSQTTPASRRLADLAADLDAARAAPDDLDHTRVRLVSTELSAEPAPVPLPGRHASRRPSPPLLPETLRGRIRLGPGAVAVLAVLVAAGLAVTTWWVLRGSPEELPPPTLSSATDPALVTPVLETSDAAAPDGEVVVDVAGKVKRPGIVVLTTGARVVDALDKAGGARRGVDLSALNLARPLVDGEQILVGVPGAGAGVAPGVASAPAPGSAEPGGALVSLNSATAAQLEELPEVGPVTAQAIIDWRTENGAFTSIEELLEVDGIGEATLEQVTPYVTL